MRRRYIHTDRRDYMRYAETLRGQQHRPDWLLNRALVTALATAIAAHTGQEVQRVAALINSYGSVDKVLDLPGDDENEKQFTE